ncbi:MAG: flagellar assembly peptidoglycan hydrolase FlgJ [Woeseiaceae bacterium]|nr:flagellar assembly peptidoglycan hydrolase FlgJ [Woeseiaceae bacterium]
MTVSATDFNQFTEMRAAAERKDPAVINEVANQFEALFLQMMLKNMRAASFGDPLMGDSKQHELYQDMMDKQLSLEMANGKGVGLAEKIVEQLGGTPVKHVPEPLAIYRPIERVSEVGLADTPLKTAAQTGTVESGPALATARTAGPTSDKQKTEWNDPVTFAKAVWPHVKNAANRLNVSPVGVLAQAALETGWGAKVMPGNNGASSLNLFGIKAANGWQGDSVARKTVEFDGDVARQEVARFRAYPDVAATFSDYASFLGDNPRYESVKNTGGNIAAFAKALADSGYATDPRYAQKIQDIFSGPTMKRVLESLGDAGY